MTTGVRLQHEPIDVAAEVAKLASGRTDVGAIVTFTGICRADENGEIITALTL
jgi:molybdopterin synthase catalytic subunit